VTSPPSPTPGPGRPAAAPTGSRLSISRKATKSSSTVPARDLEDVRYIAGTVSRVDFTHTADHLIVESPEDPALADYLAHDLIFE
jgi:hypothetical protein